MTNATLTEQYMMSILQQESEGAEFPINFDDIWESSGYTHKHHAVRFLTERCDAVEGEDYLVLPERVQTLNGGRSSHLIRLSSDGYEFFLSRSNTPQGKANLKCLIQIKKTYFKQLERQLNASLNGTNEVEDLKTENKLLEAQLGNAQRWAINATEMYESNLERLTELEEELDQTNGYSNNLLEDLEKLTNENNELEREKKRIAYDEHQKLDMEIRQMLHLYKDVIAENENLKGENYKVHKDLNDRRKGFLKKVENENFKLRDLVKQLKEIQKECFLATNYAQAIIHDVQDFVNNDCSTDWYELVLQLLKKIKPQLLKAYDLNDKLNNLLGVDIDWGKIVDESSDSDKSLFSSDDE